MHWQLAELVDRLAARPRTGLVFVDEYGHRRDYMFAEIAEYSQRYASVLRAFGVGQDDLAYVRLSTTARCAFVLLALQRLGARLVRDERDLPDASAIISNRDYRVSVDQQRERFAADARYLIIGEEREGWARLDTLVPVAPPMQGPEGAGDEELAEVQLFAASSLGALETDVVWCALQSSDVEWFERAVAQPWLCGAAAVAHNSAFNAPERLALLAELDVTILAQPASDYAALLELPDAGSRSSRRLRRCFVLSGDCSDELAERWAERFGLPLTPAGALSPQRT